MSRGPRTLPQQPLDLELWTAVETDTPLPLTLTMAHSTPPVSQDGPRREAATGGVPEVHPTTRYSSESLQERVPDRPLASSVQIE